MIRRAVLNPADERETLRWGGFFGFNADALDDNLKAFFSSLDQYPLHYVSHLMHASEVIAYEHYGEATSDGYRGFFLAVYHSFCKALHLNPESRKEMMSRLTLDRVAAGTVEGDF